LKARSRIGGVQKKNVYLESHRNINIGQSRPRGQPRKTASALTKQSDVKVSSDSLSDSTEDESPDPSPLKKVIKKKVTKNVKPRKSPKKRGRKPKNKD